MFGFHFFKAGNNTQLSSSEGRLGLKRVVSRDDSGI